MQNIYSKGQTSYNSLVGAILIALTLLLFHVLISRLFKNRLFSLPALAFFPSAMLLTLITGCIINEDNTISQSSAITTFIISSIIYIFVLSFIFKFKINFGHRFLKELWVNILIMSTVFLYVCSFCNNNKKVHLRAYVEQCLLQRKYKEALTVLKSIEYNDNFTTLLTTYALSCESKLQDYLFEYNPKGKSQSLLPTNTNNTLIFPQDEFYKRFGLTVIPFLTPIKQIEYSVYNGHAKRQAVDYILCGYLLDGNIDAFANTIGKFYEINDSLPKHYKEALILYRHLVTAPSIIYKNSIMDADFIDYQRLEQEITDYRKRKNKIRDIYGNTYWYYFNYIIS